MGIRSQSGNGNDAQSVYTIASKTIAKIRSGEGPYFLEFTTYRWREHCGPNYDNHIGYRTEDEFLKWKKKDPVLLYEKKLIAEGLITSNTIDKIDKSIEKDVEQAFVFAEESPFPDSKEANEHVYFERTNES